MKPRNGIMWILLPVLVVLAMSAGVQAQELREVPASEILEKIQVGEDVYLENVRITGEFNLSKIELEIVHSAHEGWQIKYHSLAEELKIVESKIVIISSIFENNTDFSNTQFKKHVDFHDVSFLDISDFRGVSFGGDTNFMSANFGGDTNFMSASFGGDANFVSASFNSYANFWYATFDDDADFEDVRFGGYANFEDVSFGGDANFEDVSFGDDADFEYASFGDYANFEDVSFDGYADFGYAGFGDYANFEDVSFDGYADFWYARFDGYADFWYARFGDYADFEDVSFGGDVDFGDATFDSYADFEDVSFDGDADFWHATFDSYADFEYTSFGGYANFDGASFGGDAYFGFMSFGGEVDFSDACFGGDANFVYANFDSYADFWHASFGGYANFSDVSFGGYANFDGASFSGYTIFNYAEFNKVYFLTTTFTSVSLYETDFKSMRVDWISLKDTLVFDGPVYIKLIKNFRDMEQFGDADDAYYQYRRLSQANKEWSFSKLGDIFIWLSCGYGVKPQYTIILAVVMILIFTIIYWLGNGIRRLKESDEGEYLFSWGDVPGKDNERLIRYLGSNFGIDQAENVEIRKSDDRKTICICNEGESTKVMIDEKEEKATLKTSDHETLHLKVKKENGELNIYKEGKEDVSFCDAFYFSVVTFTTLGYGDWYPKDRYRKFVMIEGLVGWLILALFLVTLANVMIRP